MFAHSLVRYPPLQKIIHETKLSYPGSLLLARLIKLLRIVYPSLVGNWEFTEIQAWKNKNVYFYEHFLNIDISLDIP